MPNFRRLYFSFAALLIVIFWIAAPADGWTQNSRPVLRFRPDSTFKVAQFTDIHWDPAKPNSRESAATIRMVLELEKPDLAIFTGDIVVAAPAAEGWRAIGGIMAETAIPWAVTLGNHDDETDLSRAAIFQLLESLPGFAGEAGPANLPGAGTSLLPLLAAAGDSVAALIYCFDSLGYPPDRKKYGSYDWIKFDQIVWYRETSRRCTEQNGGEPLPALAFMHIPLPEHLQAWENKSGVGVKKEGVFAADINSGLLASLIEMGDVMAVSVGHDHDNNYIGVVGGIALAFGQSSGANGYGELERGSRIFQLRQGQRGFASWIRTRSGASFPFSWPAAPAR